MNSISVQDSTGAKSARLGMIERTLRKALKKLKLNNVHVDVTLVSDKEIKRLNYKYRKKNKPTDVLSFTQRDMKMGKLKILGDIIIAKPTTIKQAKKAGNKINDEFAMLAVHGLLHLLGYDHERIKDEKVMFALQRKLLEYAQT